MSIFYLALNEFAQLIIRYPAMDAQLACINELQDFIKQQPAHLEAFDEALVKRWLERIIVWDDHFTVELKSGLKIEIEG